MLELLLLAQAVGPGYIPVPGVYQRPTAFICVNDSGSFVHLRSAPSTSAKSLAKLYQGNIVTPVRSVPVNGMYWTAVQTYGGRTGWVRDDYICVAAD